MKTSSYSFLLKTPTKDKWKRIGINKKTGIAVPLFSVYTSQSCGIGDFNDLKILIDFCRQNKFTILQLLPINELGSDFSPYNSISTFALEPMYLSLEHLKQVNGAEYNTEINKLRAKYRKKERVDYSIKNEKLKILRKIFNEQFTNSRSFESFVKINLFWLKEYGEFKYLKEVNKNKSWEIWKINNLKSINKNELDFYYWLQWQCFEQLKEVKSYAKKNGILLMGDLPLLVSRDSADVWSNPEYFKLEYAAGAPPDFYFQSGQMWGMPPYNWKTIKKDKFIYLANRLEYAENFYDMYRIDHFIGLFRIWTIQKGEPASKGFYNPRDEKKWKQQGEEIIKAMIKSSKIMPVAEDLGTVPKCSYEALNKYGICGMDFQRSLKNPHGTFKSAASYRRNSVVTISTHDSSFFFNWWKFEASKKEKSSLLIYLGVKKNSTLSEVISSNFKVINSSSAIFNIQLLFEYLALDKSILKKMSVRKFRINKPGMMSSNNWTIKLPVSLEKFVIPA